MKNTAALLRASALVLISLCCTGGANAQTITGLGFLPGGTRTHAYAMSQNGEAVVGWGNSSSGNHAFYWTRATGLLDLGTLPGGTDSFARAVSNTGVVVGDGSTPEGRRAWRWTAQTGMQSLGTLPEGTNSSYAYAITPDGSVIVGSSSINSFSTQRAYRWTGATGMVQLPSLTSNNYYAGAQAISDDGSIVAGTSDSGFGNRSVRWRFISGAWQAQDLGWQGGWPTNGWGMSGDGATVVGYGGSVNGSLANRWTAATGIQPLGVLPGFQYSYSYAATSNGSVIIGASGTGGQGGGVGYYHAHLWTQAGGLVDLNSFLAERNVPNIAEWDLNVGHAITSDGMTFAGEGTHNGLQEAWIASLHAPPATCGPQDFNGDGDSGTDQDIEAFFACLGGSCCATCWPAGADFNGDGDTGTDQDIEAFFRVLGGGVC